MKVIRLTHKGICEVAGVWPQRFAISIIWREGALWGICSRSQRRAISSFVDRLPLAGMTFPSCAINQGSAPAIQHALIDLLTASTVETIQTARPDISELQVYFTSLFIVTGIINAALRWLDNPLLTIER